MTRIELAVTPEQKTEILEFITTVALELYGCEPSPPSPLIFAARQDGELAGAASLRFPDTAGGLTMRNHWDFNQSESPLPFESGQVAQISHWIAKKPGISLLLLYASALFSKTHGCSYWLAEAKPKIIEALKRSGFGAYRIEKARLLLEKVPDAGQAYYQGEPVSLYMFDLDDMIRICRSRLDPPINLALLF